MSRVSAYIQARHVPHLAILAIMSVGVAGCSSDTSRFSSPFSNPFASRSNSETTGSVARQAPPPAQVQSQSVQSQALPPVASAPQSYPAQSYPSQHAGASVSGGGSGLGSFNPSQNGVDTTASISAQPQAQPGWTAQGGTPIIVGSSDTVDILAKRYNVPATAIMQANKLSGPRALQPGQRLIIPRNSVRTSAAPVLSEPQTQAAIPAQTGNVHVVASGETLMALSRRYKVSVADLTRANPQLGGRPGLRIGDKVNIPGKAGRVVQQQAAQTEPVATKVKDFVAAAPQKMASNVVATSEPVAKARVASATVTPEDEPAPSAVKAADATGGLPSFRWPVRGRVIAGYGAKTNGKQNDGINVSVPEGTPIKAAEDGVVAYAGNELKGYGNLVLVRHSSGYVTAYAHASEIAVKRGDNIKRGQVLGKAGQTGDVTSPQVHFEIRKGSSPVDPTKFLNGA